MLYGDICMLWAAVDMVVANLWLRPSACSRTMALPHVALLRAFQDPLQPSIIALSGHHCLAGLRVPLKLQSQTAAV